MGARQIIIIIEDVAPCAAFPHPGGAWIKLVGEAGPAFTVPIRPGQLTWSPDGKQLLLSPANLSIGPTELYAVGADGSNLHRLTTDLGARFGATWRQ